MPALLCCSFESDLMCQSCEPWIPAALLSFCRCRRSATREHQTHCTEHLNSGHSAKVLNLCDFQKQAARGVVSVSQRQTSGYHLDGRDWSTDNLDREFGTAGFQKTEPQQRGCVQSHRSWKSKAGVAAAAVADCNCLSSPLKWGSICSPLWEGLHQLLHRTKK